MRTLLFSLSFLLIAVSSMGQIMTFQVSPTVTDSLLGVGDEDHVISVNRSTSNNRLILFLGGTGSQTDQYVTFRRQAARLGFAVISLSYPNEVATASLSDDVDSMAFDNYREEICFGTEISDDVQVDSLNSILRRFELLLTHLLNNNQDHSWENYLEASGKINWSKIVIAGHSQGSGHAAYLGKEFLLDRVVMFSGPNDYSDRYQHSAQWLSKPGLTPASKYFGYLSLFDEAVDFAKQLENLAQLGLLENTDSTLIDSREPPFENAQALYTRQDPGIVLIHHNVPVKNSAINSLVWEYMLGHTITSSIAKTSKWPVTLFPNPTKDHIRLKSERGESVEKIIIYNLIGQQFGVQARRSDGDLLVELIGFFPGVYFLKYGQHQAQVFIIE